MHYIPIALSSRSQINLCCGLANNAALLILLGGQLTPIRQSEDKAKNITR